MKQIISIVSRKTNTDNDPSLWLLKSERSDLYTDQREENQKMTNNKDFMDFTIYRG